MSPKDARREPFANFDLSGKELDQETGFYYYGARYLNPKTSMWISVDPAMGDYIPSAPVDDEARKRNGNLPGMGGVYNYVNMHVYHYAGNNPVKFIDPDGRDDEKAQIIYYQNFSKESITISYGGNSYTLGKDIDFGDEVPLDAELNVPKGTLVEIETSKGVFSFRGYTGTIHNVIQLSEDLDREKKSGKNKLYGGIEIISGALLIGGSVISAIKSGGTSAQYSAAGMKAGFTILALGIARLSSRQGGGSPVSDIIDVFTPAELTTAKIINEQLLRE